MPEKVCIEHNDQQRNRRLAGLVILFLIVVFIVIFSVWVTLQPKKPNFTLEDATIFNLNVSAPNVISTTVQVTVKSQNSNSKIGIYYEAMKVHATFHNQQITYDTTIPPVYQAHRDLNVWSPFLYGDKVPVSPYNVVALSQEKSEGAILLTVKINGRVKWRVGSFVSGHYHLHVTCPAYIPIENSMNTGIVVGNAVKYQLSESCIVNV